MAKVAIVIPAYNVEEYIHRALESCINQTEQDIEIIVIDDGSTDETGRIIEKYAKLDSRIIFEKQQNGGVSNARNHALDLVSADYVLFLDSDDWIEENTVEVLIKNKNQSKAQMICTDCFFVDISKNERMNKVRQDGNADRHYLNSNELLHYVGRYCVYRLNSSCYKLFDNSIIQKNNLRFDPSIEYGEDGLFTFQYLRYIDTICYIPIPLWNILDRPGSATKAGYNSKWLTGIKAVEKMLEEDGIDKETQEALLELKAVRAMTILIIAIRSKDVSLNEIKFLRAILRNNCYYLLKKKKEIKLQIKVIVLICLPVFILRVLLKSNCKN